MARDRDLLVNFERMRREMDELFGDVWGEGGWWSRRPQTGFSPRVDVYYCGGPPRGGRQGRAGRRHVWTRSASRSSGRELVVSGERPVQETEGRVYQQVEIEAGPFRRVVELNADVVAEEAKATYEDGILRVELPLRTSNPTAHRVPIESKQAPAD